MHDTGLCGGQRHYFSEPSVVATDERNQKVVAVGKRAEALFAQSPETVKIHRPLVNGVIADYSVTRTLLNYILGKVVRTVQRMRVMLGVPAIASDVEKRAVMEALFRAGAKEAYLIETARLRPSVRVCPCSSLWEIWLSTWAAVRRI